MPSIDSYLGQVGYSFYGGPNGADFHIAKVFKNRAELFQDAAKQYETAVPIGAYVLVSYGDVNSSEYENNREPDSAGYLMQGKIYGTEHNGNALAGTTATTVIDTNIFNYANVINTSLASFTFKTDPSSSTYYYANQNSIRRGSYNGTLWEKKVSASGVIYYEELASLQGQAINFTVTGATVPANITPTVEEESDSTYDNKKYIVKIPVPWSISINRANSWTAATTPIQLTGPTIDNNNSKLTWTINKPRAHKIQLGNVTQGNPSDEVQVAMVDSVDNNNGLDVHALNFTIPKAWNIGIQAVNSTYPNENPTISISSTSTDKNLIFTLPRPWTVGIGNISQTFPSESPSLSVTSNTTSQILNFTLPRPWEIAIEPDDNWSPANTPLALTGPQPDGNTLTWTINKPRAHSITLGSIVSGDPSSLVQVEMVDSIDNTQGLDIHTLNFTIPKAWNIALGNVDIVDPSEDPAVSLSTNEDTKNINFTIPKPWNIALGADSGNINPGVSPVSIGLDTIYDPNDPLESDTTKYLHYQAQKAWKVNKGIVTSLSPDQNPTVSINRSSNDPGAAEDEGDSLDTKYIHIGLPRTWGITYTAEYALPNTDPLVEMIESGDNKELHFVLPRAQEFTEDSFHLTALDPAASMSINVGYRISDEETRQYPQVNIGIPRAPVTKYGDLSIFATTENLTNVKITNIPDVQDLDPGDFYINTIYGTVHKIISNSNERISTEYQGSYQIGLPIVNNNTVPLTPYDSSGNPQAAQLSLNSTTYPVEGWEFNFTGVKAPDINLVTNFTSSLNKGSSTKTIWGGQTIVYSVTIPKGTAIFSGNEPTTNLDPGDLWINNDGILKTRTNASSWSTSGIILKGKNFAIKNANPYEINTASITNATTTIPEATLPDATSPGTNTFYHVIGTLLQETIGQIDSNQVVNVAYTDSNDSSHTSSHWIFKPASSTIWSGSKLTGDAGAQIIFDDWVETNPNTDKGYSQRLINELRAQLNTSQTALELTQASLASLTTVVDSIVHEIGIAWGTLPLQNN